MSRPVHHNSNYNKVLHHWWCVCHIFHTSCHVENVLHRYAIAETIINFACATTWLGFSWHTSPVYFEYLEICFKSVYFYTTENLTWELCMRYYRYNILNTSIFLQKYCILIKSVFACTVEHLNSILYYDYDGLLHAPIYISSWLAFRSG